MFKYGNKVKVNDTWNTGIIDGIIGDDGYLVKVFEKSGPKVLLYREKELTLLQEGNTYNDKLVIQAIKFQSFDYLFIINMELEMLEKFYEYYKNSYRMFENRYVYQKIELAIKLLRISVNNDCFTILDKWYDVSTNYVNMRNASRFIKSDTYAKEVRTLKAWHLYNKLRTQYLQTWWD